MELIFSHQNADFDAVASMLGAKKLYPEAIAVLPSRLHASVREFLALYRNGFPFVAWEDFRYSKEIQRLILTDSATRPEIKGMPKDIPTLIFEHHALERDLKAYETWLGEEIGAASTLLVEQIRAQHIPLNSLEATLLALGIYADTGNFTYGGTTPRDIEAASWLLQQGAVLDTIRRFLASPLNAEQQTLFEKLMENVQERQIMGYELCLALAHEEKHVDSINSVVSILRDVLDADAIFVLVAMPNNVQLICRSTEDAIHVGEVAQLFGGGGHPRASAAAIYKKNPDEISAEIWAYLESHIQAPTHIADLMSFGAQTVKADEKILDIIQRIRKIGHEGYPVLDNGKVVGLLTLRDADKTLEHGLKDARVRDVMLGGSITLEAQDPVSRLEETMVESDWGQIPIVDSDKKLIGIVTRTDLIKHWGRSHPTAQSQAPSVQENQVVEVLGEANYALITIIAALAQAQDLSLAIVGGVVRDLLLKRPNFDIDFVLEANAIEFAEKLKNAYGGRIHPYPPFGTATWILDEASAKKMGLPFDEIPQHLDFASARHELYEHPSALPSVYNSGIKLDLRRRDFTINTLAIQLSPRRAMWQILDFYGGMTDLEAGKIRVLHSLSFVDDPTRILRAVRFAQRLNFKLEARTAELVNSALPVLKRITGERLQNELSLLLKEETAIQGLLQLDSLAVLAAIHPKLDIEPELIDVFARLSKSHPDWEVDNLWLRWHLLLAKIPAEYIAAICQRLLIGQTKIDTILQTAELVQSPILLKDPNTKVSELVELLSPLSKESLLAAWLYLEDKHSREQLERYVSEWQHIKPYTDGNTLKALGLKPSPVFRVILAELKRAWLDGEISTEAEENKLLKELIRKHSEN